MNNKKNILLFVSFSFLLFLTSCKKTELTAFIPKDALGYVRIKNISKTIENFDTTFNPKESFLITIGEILEHKNIKSKEELCARTGIDIDKDLALFWMDENLKSPSYVYQVKNCKEIEKGFIDQVKSKENGRIIYNNINIYVLQENPKNTNFFIQTQCLSGKFVFFMEDYLVKCSSENDAKKIIDLYKDPEKNKDLSLKSNENFLNVITSLKDSNIFIYIDINSLTQKYLPMIKMMSGMFLQNPKIDKTQDKKNIKILQSIINLSIWSIEQINSTGISIDFNKDLVIDYYLGFKSDSPLQNVFKQPESKLAHSNFIQSSNPMTIFTKTNPNTIKEISNIFFDFFDSTSLDLNTREYEKLKKTFNDTAENIAAYYDTEMSITLLPLKNASQIQFSILNDLKNTDKKIDVDYLIDYMKLSGLDFINPIEQISKIKIESAKKIELINKRITKYYNIDIYSNDITFSNYPEHKTFLNDYREWKAIYNNKLIICYSKDSTAIEETIDILSGKNKISSLNKSNKFNDAKKLLHENPDALFIISLKEIIEAFINFDSFNSHGTSAQSKKYDIANNKNYKNFIDMFKDTDTIKFSYKYQNNGLSYRFILPDNVFNIFKKFDGKNIIAHK